MDQLKSNIKNISKVSLTKKNDDANGTCKLQPKSVLMYRVGGVTGPGGVRGDLVESGRSEVPAEEHQRQRPDAAKSSETRRRVVAPHERLLHQVSSRSPASLQNGQNAAWRQGVLYHQVNRYADSRSVISIVCIGAQLHWASGACL